MIEAPVPATPAHRSPPIKGKPDPARPTDRVVPTEPAAGEVVVSA